jgi:hypothetical protein
MQESPSDGERELERLLAELNPTLFDQRFVFEPASSLTLDGDVFALIREAEGITAIRPSADGEWARISLGVHSSLGAVDLTAALSRALAEAGIATNIVAALRHDHLFVPWDLRNDALNLLRRLA